MEGRGLLNASAALPEEKPPPPSGGTKGRSFKGVVLRELNIYNNCDDRNCDLSGRTV
jgi:hypothetical protein